MPNKISVIARATALQAETDRMRQLAEELAGKVRAEPGNVRFEVYAEPDSGTIVFIEEYADQAAFEAHLNMPHTRQFNRILQEIAEGGASTVTMLDRLA